MISLIHKLLKAILLMLGFLSNFTLLPAAVDERKDVLADLTSNTEQTYRDKKPYKKEVSYFLNNTLVGFIKYGASGTQATYGRIDRLEINSRFRSQGLGSHILKQALQDLKNDGYQEVRLEPKPFEAPCKDYWRESERLIKFYEKHGFKVSNPARTIMQIHFDNH